MQLTDTTVQTTVSKIYSETNKSKNNTVYKRVSNDMQFATHQSLYSTVPKSMHLQL